MTDPNDRVLAPERRPEDQVNHALRPRLLKDLLGQERVKENLSILIDAARQRGEALDHVLFHGPPGLGKCITPDSLILTDRGLVEFRRLLPPDLAPNEYAPCDVRVYGREGLEPASHVYAAGRVPTLRLRTRSGFALQGTPHHPVLVASPSGPIWKTLATLSEDDYVAIARDTQAWGPPHTIDFEPRHLNGDTRRDAADARILAAHSQLLAELNRAPTTPELELAYSGAVRGNPTPRLAARRLGLPLSDGRQFPNTWRGRPPGDQAATAGTWGGPQVLGIDLAYFMGVVVGDGHFETGTNGPQVVITASEPEMHAEIIRISQAQFGVTPSVRQYGDKAPRMRFSQNIGHLLIALGVRPVLAGEKRVPESIMAGPADVASAFLQGLFDADGHAWQEGYVDWSSKSEVLARHVQLLLANMGVIAHRTRKHVDDRVYWQLFIGGSDAVKFYQRVGFRLRRKQERAERLAAYSRGANRSDAVPYAHVTLTVLFNASRPHSHALHKTFSHVIAGDRVLSKSQIDKYLSMLPPAGNHAPALAILNSLADPHIYWDRVESLVPGEADVYDFCVPGTHSFVANGLVNHNTTLAHCIANEMGVNIKVTAGPVIERAGDLAALLTNLRAGDILFIDEVHRLGRAVEEVLYPAMEDFALDILIGKGPSARSIRLQLPKFTVIGATTRLALLTAPLRARFGAPYRLDFYDQPAMEAIVARAADMLKVGADPEGITEIARRARGTPRVALRLLKRVRDFAQVRAEGRITQTVARDGLELLEIDELGLDNLDRQVLLAIIEKYSGGPVGLETIAASISEESDTIMDVVEPYLLQKGFLDRTPRGRIVTRAAYEHLGLPYHGPEQARLL